MPSNSDPNDVVKPGPGRLSAGVVPASALSFSANGGGDLAAHISDPVDAHLAHAIGVNEVYPATGEALLASAGGPYNGESMLDALYLLKDLLPVRPDRIGFNDPAIPNSGQIDWEFGGSIKGGYTDGGQGYVTQNLASYGLGNETSGGTIYPADRGVLALYKTTGTNFANAGQTTLLAALWLGATTEPSGIPAAYFTNFYRNTIQPAQATSPSVPGIPGSYTPSNLGLDKFSLENRLPYLSDYTAFSGAFANYTLTFPAYQLANFYFPINILSKVNGSYLLVHWKEQYAQSLASIQPAALAGGVLIASNCYSAVASNTLDYGKVHRDRIYNDNTPTDHTAGTISTTPGGTLTTVNLSGLAYYSSSGLTFNTIATCNGLFEAAYYTNVVASASVPVGFESPVAPVSVNMTDFGGDTWSYPLYDGAPSRILNNVSGLGYSLGSPPAAGDVVRFQHSAQAIGNSASLTPYPYGQVRVKFSAPYRNDLVMVDSKFYLYRGGGFASETEERFETETYRYPASFTILNTSPMTPAAPFASAAALTANNGELQVYAGRLVYPSIDFTAANYQPAQAGRNYAAVLSGDAASHKRRYQRVFNTTIAKNTATLTITGLAFSAFQASGPVDPNEVTDHPGGAIVQVKIPGVTGWLDLGRAKGDPDLDMATDFRGCRTAINGNSYTFETGGFTANNGSGKYLLIVRVTFIKGPGSALILDTLTLS